MLGRIARRDFSVVKINMTLVGAFSSHTTGLINSVTLNSSHHQTEIHYLHFMAFFFSLESVCGTLSLWQGPCSVLHIHFLICWCDSHQVPMSQLRKVTLEDAVTSQGPQSKQMSGPGWD